MKYFPLVWAGLWRKKARTILTLLSITVAFILFGVLQGVNAGFGAAASASHLNMLVTNNMGFGPLPMSTLQQIEAIPGVTKVGYFGQPLFGTYQQPANRVFGFPTDIDRFLEINSEIKLPAEQRAALLSTRTGVIIGAKLAEKYQLKIGDRLPVDTKMARKDGSTTWVLDIVGIFSDPDTHRFEQGFLFNYNYFDEERASGSGTVAQFHTVISDPTASASIIATIDAMYENSPFPTISMTEREQAESQIASLGDIGYIVNAIVAAAFFTLLFLTGNTMTQSVRERLNEFAVLKTLGFSSGAVAGFIIAEAALLCAAGAVLGLGIASALYPIVSQNLPGVGRIAGSVLIAGAVAALVVALVSSLPPAWRVNRLQIVDALAGR